VRDAAPGPREVRFTFAHTDAWEAFRRRADEPGA